MSNKIHNTSAYNSKATNTIQNTNKNKNTIVSATKIPNIGLKIYVNDFVHTCIS